MQNKSQGALEQPRVSRAKMTTDFPGIHQRPLLNEVSDFYRFQHTPPTTFQRDSGFLSILISLIMISACTKIFIDEKYLLVYVHDVRHKDSNDNDTGCIDSLK